MLDLNSMAIFAAVARAQSFTGAAQTLGMPKSTVSQRIAELEARLGVRLLQRTTRKVRLTEAGSAYYERCARLVSEAEEADRALTHLEDSACGTLRVAAALPFGHSFLGPIVAEYLRRNAKVSIEVLLSDRQLDPIEDGLDAVICASPSSGAGEAPAGSYIARRLGTAVSRCCASPAYLRGRGRLQRPAELAAHDCITGPGALGETTWTFEGPDGIEQVAVQSRLRASSVLFVRDAAVLGLGVALLPAFLLQEEAAAGRLVPILPAYAANRTQLQIVYPQNRYLAGRVRAFVDLLVERLASEPTWEPASAA